jgi:hypothetical protein
MCYELVDGAESERDADSTDEKPLIPLHGNNGYRRG